MSNQSMSQECSILNKSEDKDSIDVNKIIEANQKESASYYVEKFNFFAKKTVKSTLEMCRVVFEAKENLQENKSQYYKFLEQIGHTREDSTIRKYIAIGSKYDRFIDYTDRLPNSWTSIYQITQLPPDAFESLLLAETSMANLTCAQLQLLMNKSPKKNDKSQEKSDESADNEKPSSPIDSSKPSNEFTSQSTQETSISSQETEDKSIPETTSHSIESASTSNQEANTSTASSGSNDNNSSAKDDEYAQAAISNLVQSSARSTSDQEKPDSLASDKPYELVLRFESAPCHDAVAMLTKCLEDVKRLYNAKFEVVLHESTELFA